MFLELDLAEMHLRLKNIFSSVFISSVTANPLMRFAILNLTRAVANNTKKIQQSPKNITPMSDKPDEISLNEKYVFFYEDNTFEWRGIFFRPSQQEGAKAQGCLISSFLFSLRLFYHPCPLFQKMMTPSSQRLAPPHFDIFYPHRSSDIVDPRCSSPLSPLVPGSLPLFHFPWRKLQRILILN